MAFAARWAAGVRNEDIAVATGYPSLSRGLVYHRQGRVRDMSTSDDGRRITASVMGSEPHPYRSMVTVGPDESFAVSGTTRCNCPIGGDCKHVAALLLRARELASAGEPVPAWQASLERVVRMPVGDASAAVVALEVAIVDPRASFAGASQPGPAWHLPYLLPRVTLRPLMMGKSGRWVRSGVSWADLRSPYDRVHLQPAQHDILRELLALFEARQPYWSNAQPTLDLALLGAVGIEVLARASASGIALIGEGRTRPPVHISDDPVVLDLDLRAGRSADQLLLAPRFTVGGRELERKHIIALGHPPHGLVWPTSHDPEPALIVGRLDPLPDRSLAPLLRESVPIPRADLPRFLSGYYPLLRQRSRLVSSDSSVELPEISPPRLAVQVRFGAEHTTGVQWAFRYRIGTQIVDVPAGPANPSVTVPRDQAAEQQLLADLVPPLDLQHLHQLGFTTDAFGRAQLPLPRTLQGRDTVLFATEMLPVLRELTGLELDVAGEPVDYRRTDDEALIEVSATDSPDEAGTDWFDLHVDVSVGGERVPLADLLRALTLGESQLILDSGTWFTLDRPELDTLRRLLEEAQRLGDPQASSLRISRYHAGLWDELVQLGVVTEQSEAWHRTVGALLDLDQLPTPAPPDMLRATLRPYQLQGYHWLSLLWDTELGGILADDMGLGKTVQTLAVLARAGQAGGLDGRPALVVAPTSVIGTWTAEAARFVPDLPVVGVTSTTKRRGTSLSDELGNAAVVITSYALLRLDFEEYQAQDWSILILDEAQFIKNRQSQVYRCARRLRAPRKLAITGTPLENNLMDLWSLLSVVAPGLFPDPDSFTELYRRPIESGADPDQLSRLRQRIQPVMRRRTKEQVEQDLPSKQEQVVAVTLTPQHRTLYDRYLHRERQRILGLVDDLSHNRITVLRALTRLRQLSLAPSLVDDAHAAVRSSKIDVFSDMLTEVAAEGHRALVFSQFTGFLRLVRDRLDAERLPYVYLDGRTRNRQERIAEFTQGSAPAFLISLKAGGFGLTLTEADYVFILDPWWNPAAERQAIDRTHRIGQDKQVMVYRLVSADTIEDKVVALQERKRDLFDRVVDADGELAAPLSADDIRGLLSP